VNVLREMLLSRFRWIGGHADVLGLLEDATFLAEVGRTLWEPFSDSGVTKVAAVEARAFVLGTAAALSGGVGIVAIRKPGAVDPGPKAVRMTEPDWRGRRVELALRRAAVAPGDRVLVVDDWAETGSQALAARKLVEECGGSYVGLSLLVDQLPAEVRERLAPVTAVARHDELPSSDG
jgi:adenine phosphoribosyltransferase